jgi:hypothetical protein
LENVGKFYGNLEYIMDIFCSFGTFFVHLVHFSGFGITHHEKSGNPVLLQRPDLKTNQNSVSELAKTDLS